MKSMRAERVKFERLSIIESDLSIAARFLREYLERALYDSQGSPDGVLGEALTVAIIVTYARPFMRNYDRKENEGALPVEEEIKKRKKRESFDTSFLTAPLLDQQRSLHNMVLYERNKAFAHSDAGPREIRVVDTLDGRLTISNVVRVLLEKREAEELLANVCQMQALLKPHLEQLLAAITANVILPETGRDAK